MKSSKGINQVDFAIAISVVIVIFSLAIWQTSNYFTASFSPLKSEVLRSSSKGLEESFFAQKGIPVNWHWKNRTIRPSLETYIYRVPIYLEEYNDTSYSNLNVKVEINPSERYNFSTAYNSSIKAYLEREPLPTDITNQVDSEGDGFLEKFDVIFRVDEIQANGEKTVSLYYSQDNTTQASYSSLTEDSHTLNITVFSEEKLSGLTNYKLEALKNLSYPEVREKFNAERQFNLSLGCINWSYGRRVPGRASVQISSKPVLYQNKTAFIKTCRAEVRVW